MVRLMLINAVTQSTALAAGLALPLPEYVRQKAMPSRVMVVNTKTGLYLANHVPNVTLTSPKLASTMFICHMNAPKKAETTAPLFS